MLNQNQRDTLAKRISSISGLYGKDINRQQIIVYIETLEEFIPATFEQYVGALNSYALDTTHKFFPAPIELRRYIHPEPDNKLLAIEMARKIDKAVINHGNNWESGFFNGRNPTSEAEYLYFWEAYGKDGKKSFGSFKEAVIYEIGEVGWHAICSRGTWSSLCASANTMDEGTFIAQLRDQIMASYTLQKQGIDITKIKMLSAEQYLQLEVDQTGKITNMEKLQQLSPPQFNLSQPKLN